MTLVVDASLAIEACIAPRGFQALSDHALVAPAIMWSETMSILHERQWREDLTEQQAAGARTVLVAAPVARVDDPRIQEHAWRLADELGWAKTRPEYVALAQILSCRLLTVDARLRRGTDRLGFVITPEEL